MRCPVPCAGGKGFVRDQGAPQPACPAHCRLHGGTGEPGPEPGRLEAPRESHLHRRRRQRLRRRARPIHHEPFRADPLHQPRSLSSNLAFTIQNAATHAPAGLTREWFSLVAVAIRTLSVVRSTEKERASEYYLNPRAGAAKDLELCQFIGGFIGKARNPAPLHTAAQLVASSRHLDRAAPRRRCWRARCRRAWSGTAPSRWAG